MYHWFVTVVEEFGEGKIKISQDLPQKGILLGLAQTQKGARQLIWEKVSEQDEKN